MQSVTRRSALAALAAVSNWLVAPPAGAAPPVWPTAAPLGPAQAFSFDRLKQRARSLAKQPYAPQPGLTPAQAQSIDYDAFARVTYGRSATLWGELPGDEAIRFFPLGRAAPRPVTISVVSAGQARRVLYAPDLFDMPANSPIGALGDHAGFGGFRALNADRKSDWLAFLGASYFRTSDPMNQFGLSARGIAIDTGLAQPEEFPAFTAFWLERGPEGLVVYALLDGPSLAGAYRIAHSRSPKGLVQEITTELHFRKPVAQLGVAPLTSMYWYGASDRKPAEDWRPQIHDSDGLAIWTGAGERIWRPLADPAHVRSSAFLDRGPRGFGLLQRDRNFADYQDDGIFYERRPSAWVEPIGDWGEGAVQLIEIPTAGETQDNIVAFWRPGQAPSAGTALDLAYRLHWTADEPTAVGVARAVATRFGQAARPGEAVPASRRRFVVDFAGGRLDALTHRGDADPVVTASRGAPFEVTAYPVVGQPLWRLMFDVDPVAGAPVDLRAYLKRGGEALTETWTYQLVAV